MIKWMYEIDYPLGERRAYLEWVRSFADTLQAPDELKRLVSYDNLFADSRTARSAPDEYTTVQLIEFIQPSEGGRFTG